MSVHANLVGRDNLEVVQLVSIPRRDERPRELQLMVWCVKIQVKVSIPRRDERPRERTEFSEDAEVWVKVSIPRRDERPREPDLGEAMPFQYSCGFNSP